MIQMNEKQMLDCLQTVWENMTYDKDREAYGEMLVLLDNMSYFLRNDMQCTYPPSLTRKRIEVQRGRLYFLNIIILRKVCAFRFFRASS